MPNNVINNTKSMQNDKYFFASYLNMARHNIYLNIADIAKRLDKKPPESDDQIFSPSVFGTLKNSKFPDKALKANRLIRSKFSFVEPMLSNFIGRKYKGKVKIADASAEDYFEMFQNLFAAVNALRNEYTHEYKPSTDISYELIEDLKSVFDASVYRAQKRFEFVEQDIEHLRRMGKDGEKSNFQYAIEKDGKFTENGLAFFICLFLEKKYAYLFLKQLKDFKIAQGKEGKATLETYCAYSLKLPKFKIESEQQDSLLYMDMLNELKRCPSMLYEHLSESDKKKFSIEIEENDSNGGHEIEAVLKRHDERFTYFAMRYMDETNAFEKLRFMMDLGNYHFDVYDKEIAGQTRVRRLTKKLTTFGRFQDFSLDKLYETYGDLVKPSSDIEEDSKEKYIVETFPHYHFDDTNVGIKIIKENHLLYPNLNDASPKGAPHKQAPDVWISQQELMSLALLCQLERLNGRSTKAETIILQHYNKVRNLFDYLSKGGEIPEPDEIEIWLKSKFNGLDIHDIPKELHAQLIAKKKSKSFDNQAIAKIKKMILLTQKSLDRLENDLETGSNNRKNKIGRKEHREVKAGILADELARDMLRFQPVLEGNKGKATGMVFQVLQASLAFFGGKKDDLPLIFEDCNLIKSKNPHPFLEKINIKECRGIIDFYQKYMKAKIKYLEHCLKKTNFAAFTWIGLNKSKRRNADGFLKELATNYLTMPVFFPRGLFADAIKISLLNRSKTEEFKKIVTESERCNTVFLLQQFYKIELNDGNQTFYDWKRNYEIIDKLKDNRNANDLRARKPRKKLFYDTKELENQITTLKDLINKLPEEKEESRKKMFNRFTQNEKQIRHQKAQDMVLFFLIKDLMLSSTDKELWQQNIDNIKLSEIEPTGEKGVLAIQKPFEIEQTFKKDTNGMELKITKKITQNALKIKNFGDFRRFTKDRRLPNLMFYIQTESIERSLLESELESYDRQGWEVFKAVAEFERAAYPRYKSQITEKDKNSEHRRILELFADEFPQHRPLIDSTLAIRNAFSHNQYPDNQWFGGYFLDENNKIAENLTKFAKTNYQTFTKQISK